MNNFHRASIKKKKKKSLQLPLHFGNETNKCSSQNFLKMTSIIGSLEHFYDVFFDHVPTHGKSNDLHFIAKNH